MPFQRTRPVLVLEPKVRAQLVTLSKARTASASQIERAQMMLAYAANDSVSAIARRLGTNRPRVERCLDKALELGPLAALEDLPRSGRRRTITPQARAWVTALACQPPTQLGYSYELWTLRLLGEHIRSHCEAAGHPSLRGVARGTLSKLLTEGEVQPHRIRYYLERRDPDFDLKMAQVLCVYHEVALLRQEGAPDAPLVAYLSFDEKPGIQALENLAPDLPPVPGKHPQLARDHQYRRHGTMTLLAGIDLLTGEVHGMVADRHRSREFVAFLTLLDNHFPPEAKLRVVLDNHSAHTSKETRGYLATRPNRFEFIFTPKHGSWLNLIEAFFAKMAKTMLRGLRVPSKAELRTRILLYLQEINKAPVVFRWKYGLEPIVVGLPK